MGTETYEIYVPRKFFLELAGFSDDDFRVFTQTHEIKPDGRGYFPIFQVMTRLNLSRKKGRWGVGDADTSLKLVRIKEIQLRTAIKAKEYIPIVIAKARIKSLILSVVNKIRYSIKSASPRLVMVPDAQTIESILIDCYNAAIEMLQEEAVEIKRWEDHGLDLIEGGDNLVEDSSESLSPGSGQENSPPITQQFT